MMQYYYKAPYTISALAMADGPTVMKGYSIYCNDSVEKTKACHI